MHSSPSISDVSFVPPRAAGIDRGLLGFVALTLDGALRLDGIALRRTVEGEVALSFPALVRPVNDEVGRAIEHEVLHELAMRGLAPASWADAEAPR